jgi:hypothetical protein
MYDVKKKLPPVEEDVLLVIDLIDGEEVCEGFRTDDGHWHPYKYGRNGWGDWNVTHWMPMPKADSFMDRFLSFSLGYASGIGLVIAMMFLVG